MEGYCPNCNELTEVSEKSRVESIKVKKTEISINANYTECQKCNEIHYTLDQEENNINHAYNIYRNMYNLLSIDEIKTIREKYKLSQRQFGRLLGWSETIISQYEKGRIPDRVHNDLLVLITIPRQLMLLYHRNKVLLKESERDIVGRKILIAVHDPDELFERDCENLLEKFFNYKPTILSGKMPFNLEKFVQVISIVLNKIGPVYKTKLNKLLFYIDFLNFKKNGNSITGMQYAKWQHGPVPLAYENIFGLLWGGKIIKHNENIINGEICDEYSAIDGPNLAMFSEDELQVIKKVLIKFKGYTSEQIVNCSHKESAYLNTKDFEAIDYSLANSLSIDIEN